MSTGFLDRTLMIDSSGPTKRSMSTVNTPRRDRLPLWVPLGMLVVAFSCSFFAYLTLVAPAPARVEKRTGERKEAPTARPIEASNEEIRRMMALAPQRFRPTQVDQQAQLEAPPDARSHAPSPKTRLPEVRTVAPARRHEQPIAPAAAPQPPHPVQEERMLAAGALKEPPPIVPFKEPPPPSVSVPEPPPVVPLKESPATVASLQGEAGTAVRLTYSDASPPGPKLRTEQPRPANVWLTRMRSELDVCGQPGLWRNDLCRESVRWKYCHPDRWDSARECAVERFASSAIPN